VLSGAYWKVAQGEYDAADKLMKVCDTYLLFRASTDEI